MRLTGLLLATMAAAQSIPPVFTDTGDSAFAFDLSRLTLLPGRFRDNQDRTLAYLKFVDVDRLLYNFRRNHGLPNAAVAAGGWEAPDFPFRSHFQGHLLTAWAHCATVLRDAECRRRAEYFVAELARCQANNTVVGLSAGYLSGFPETEMDKVENRTLSNGNVPYYSLHKTMAGLLDVWRHLGSDTAHEVLLSMAAWVDTRTARLSYTQMQSMLSTEFGGMSEVLADLFHQSGDPRWLTTARRFNHAAILDPLAQNIDALAGLHANTQIPKWIGAARAYKATREVRFLDVARNAWRMTVGAHSYAIGANSQAEHFRPPNAIAGYLARDTGEFCNSYNMLKLTRELWLIDPQSAAYFDFYELALLNHVLGAQDPGSSHGHVTYFTSLNPGGRRGVGPAWGGGTYSTDYGSFWCCMGTAIESNSKLFDSVYFHADKHGTLYVNLFLPSAVDWSERKLTVTQTTDFPRSDTTTLRVSRGEGGQWTLAVRVPAWVDGQAIVRVNGQPVNVDASPGVYARITRAWADGDEVVIRLPMNLHTVAANDDAGLVAIAYGPAILSGRFGDTSLAGVPVLSLDSIRSTGDVLEFEGMSDGRTVTLGPFYEAHGHNYNVYWRASGMLPSR